MNEFWVVENEKALKADQNEQNESISRDHELRKYGYDPDDMYETEKIMTISRINRL